MVGRFVGRLGRLGRLVGGIGEVGIWDDECVVAGVWPYASRVWQQGMRVEAG